MKKLTILLGLMSLCCWQACQSPSESNQETAAIMTQTPDPHSFAQPKAVQMTHLILDLKVDFEAKQLQGQAQIHFRRHQTTADTLTLDSHGLQIAAITNVQGQPLPYTLGEAQPHLGQALRIQIGTEAADTVVVVQYKTAPDAGALQWLTPEQTGGKKQPFLFTQSQAILARTWIPCQDSPGIRFSYEARIRVPKELMALMSAENPQQRSADGQYQFRMPQPIPAYLMALAVGDLAFEAIGNTTGIYAEPAILPKAVAEFGDLDKMLQAAQELYGEYVWGRYDLLVLPPSFPFGGMENPRLTFVTPTLLAGDRSLTSVVAHELAHAWSGNLVTNATWEDLWLNEGFTVYFERRLMEKLYGEDYGQMLGALGVQDLHQTIAKMGETNPDTRLKLDLKGRDPDEGISDIAYEKGFLMLYALEQAAGREAMDVFLKKYFSTHAFQSMDTERFLTYVRAQLPEAAKAIDLDAWVFQPGLPKTAPSIESERFAAAEGAWFDWNEGMPVAKLGTDKWSSHEWLHFLRRLPDSLSQEEMSALDRDFGFTKTGNAEMLTEWLSKTLPLGYAPAYDAAAEFLTFVGRRKFQIPIYQALLKTPKGQARAKEVYAKARPNYHYLSTQTLDKLLSQ
ncbi:M1 family metallopeptidase [Eisenibacter elegans]|jgi:aminopeptidase N|uniref:M1 family metallopeptidase n=1 Tax=Eisenibacter elegans TaxID=997 RepID=UPI0004264E2F|nr:M1 family metallopeptidase [Eisenibacter elegans]